MPNIIPDYPSKDADLGLEDINDILADAGIGLPKYYEWRSRSGCYFCFLSADRRMARAQRASSNLYEKAKAFEKTEGDKKFTWVDGRTLSDVEKIKKRYEIKSVKMGVLSVTFKKPLGDVKASIYQIQAFSSIYFYVLLI